MPAWHRRQSPVRKNQKADSQAPNKKNHKFTSLHEKEKDKDNDNKKKKKKKTQKGAVGKEKSKNPNQIRRSWKGDKKAAM